MESQSPPRSDTAQTPEPPPKVEQVPAGTVASLISAVKGLTFSNALVIVILAAVGIPAYAVYKAINDQSLLDRFLSNYRELSDQNVGCTIREARLRGSSQIWAISTGFAYQGADKWMVSVVLEHEPDGDELESYCEALKLIVDFMRDPNAPSPVFPNSEKPIVKEYPRQQEDPQ